MKVLTLTVGTLVALLLVFVGIAYAQTGANFGNTCDVEGRSFADPIIEPAAGMGMAHVFFGAPNVVNSDTGDTLRNKAHGTCNRSANNSAYWVPAVYRNGTALPVDTSNAGLGDAVIYYRDGQIADQSRIEPFPRDFEMIARDANGPGEVKWGCGGSLQQTVPDTCGSNVLVERITFPQCWNGNHSSDASHNPDPVVDVGTSGCPSTYPREVPQISISIGWVLPNSTVGNITLAGDNGSKVGPGTAHADFVNGWDMGVLDMLTRDCIINAGDSAEAGAGKPAYCADPGGN